MSGRTYDFDLHGIVGVRLVDATHADLATVTRQLGPLRGDLAGAPDITVRFVDRATASPLTHVGIGDSGYNDDGFFVLRRVGGTTARARIPFADVGRGLEVVCERAMPAVPHLLALVNLTALAKGVLPLHASAFTLDGLGVLVTGWAKSGKTETLLAAVGRGACYVGDEWVYLTRDGNMYGVPEPIRVWDWHLDQKPDILARRPRRDRARLATWRGLGTLAATAASTPLPGAGLIRRGAPVVARQAYLQVPPEELFGAHRVRLHGRLDAAVLVMSHQDDGLVTRDAGPEEISRRMASSLADERATLLVHYRQYRYAFPELSSSAVENAGRREARLLTAIFDDRPAAVVAHPYPCDIAALGDAVVRAAHGVARHEVSPTDRARHEGAAS
ncbi:MAG TPA: hypothetical protein VFZ64_10870 [Nocardioidaceae bacterium]